MANADFLNNNSFFQNIIKYFDNNCKSNKQRLVLSNLLKEFCWANANEKLLNNLNLKVHRYL